jgi:histidinol dehydrogenase
MIRILNAAQVSRAQLFERGLSEPTPQIDQAVAEILAQVRQRGDAAVLDYTEKFDGVRLEALRVSQEEIDRAADACGAETIDLLTRAEKNIRAFHSAQVQNDLTVSAPGGILLGRRVLPIEKVGLYVPGGTAAYPSSVLMNAVPAKIAGCSRIVMTTPPAKDGRVPAVILAAAKVAGVTDVFAMGGAQAVAALAYGTQSVPKVDKIVGPGNIFVAQAKRQVFGTVDIDMIAGPSEILVIADRSAQAKIVAADMLSQAEHDARATAVLVCDSAELANAVAQELERQIPLLPRAQDLEAAAAAANEIAPEHLELFVDQPFDYLDAVKNAGCVFLGKNCPEALGDYWAGPNHTLPTLGTARFSSPLSVDEFVRHSNYVYYSKPALDQAAQSVVDFAQKEGLDAHANSVKVRMEQKRRA